MNRYGYRHLWILYGDGIQAVPWRGTKSVPPLIGSSGVHEGRSSKNILLNRSSWRDIGTGICEYCTETMSRKSFEAKWDQVSPFNRLGRQWDTRNGLAVAHHEASASNINKVDTTKLLFNYSSFFPQPQPPNHHHHHHNLYPVSPGKTALLIYWLLENWRENVLKKFYLLSGSLIWFRACWKGSVWKAILTQKDYGNQISPICLK